MNPNDESEAAALRTEIAKAARSLLHREIPFLEGIRKLAGFRFKVSNQDYDPDFRLFVAIDSQSDHLPSSQMRPLCADTWLALCDKESEELELFYAQEVSEACEQLLKRFS